MRYPPIAAFFGKTLAEKLAEYGDRVLWTIADLLVYNKHPHAYDEQPFHDWDFADVTDIVALRGKTVVDAGAGWGV